MENNAKNQEDFSMLLDILSIYLQIKNLELNEQQVNNLNAHLQAQDNDYLQTIIKQNKEILSILRGKHEYY